MSDNTNDKICDIKNYSRIDKITQAPKKRKLINNWIFSPADYDHSKQLFILLNDLYDEPDIFVKQKMIQEIKKKIYGYKQQDIKKKKYDPHLFIHLEDIIQKITDTQLICYYCQKEIYILYDISRECKQWTIDRINNLYGHNKDNFYLACLECNLKRRCRNDQKFLFTKQLKIVKEAEIKNIFITDDRKMDDT
jgi:hypothetical protein